MDIKDGIKAFRERMRYKTQTDLANVLGVKQATVSVWEVGDGYPTYEIIHKLFELGAKIEELFNVDYNKMHKLTVQEASTTSSNEEILRKMRQMESDIAELKCIKKGVSKAG